MQTEPFVKTMDHTRELLQFRIGGGKEGKGRRVRTIRMPYRSLELHLRR